MRNFVLLVFSLFTIQNMSAQTYEFGVFFGGSNVIGDIGSRNYLPPNQMAFGGIVKWNRSPRHAFRASVIYANIEGVDAKSSDPRRQLRNYTFRNNLLEISAGIEFTFLDFNLHDNLTYKSTPYLYSGISTAYHNNYYFNGAGAYVDEDTSSWAYGIPMVLGYKAQITPHFIFAAEVGARYTFSDEIDGSKPDYDDNRVNSIGNINNNDWYVFSGITLTYTFGRKPCYCNF